MKKEYWVKKIIIFLILTLVFYFVSGCKKVSQPSLKASDTSPAATSSSIGGIPDFGGKTVKVINWHLQPGISEAPYKDRGQEGTVMTARINEIEEKYNCVIEYVGDGTNAYLMKMNTSILTGKPNTDIAIASFDHLVQSYERGGLYKVLNDYADIIELDNADIWDQKVTKDLLTIEGLTCGVQPADCGIELVYWGSVCFFNRSLLEREGVWEDYNLYDMQKNKTWTWDAMEEIGMKVTKDRSGDGTTDQYGMIYHPNAHVAFNASNSDGGTQFGFYGLDENGKPRFRGREPERIRVLNFFHDAGPTGKGWLTAPNYGLNVHGGPRDFFASGNAAFIVQYGNVIEIFKNMGMQDTLGIVAVPMGPANTRNEYYLAREHYRPWIIPRNLGNTKDIAYVFKDLCRPMYTPEEADIGIEATLADLIGSESDIIETFKLLGNPERTANNLESPFVATWAGPIASYHGSFYAIIESGFSPEQLNDMYGDQIQTTINDYWNLVLEGVDKMKTKRKEQGIE